MRISSFTSSNGRGAAALYSTMRPAISALGATSIASVLRLLWIDSGEKSACTNFGLPRPIACACERVMNGVVSTLRSSALPTPVRLSACSYTRFWNWSAAVANFCAAFCFFSSASICALHLVERLRARRTHAGDLDDVPAEIRLAPAPAGRPAWPRTPRPRTASPSRRGRSCRGRRPAAPSRGPSSTPSRDRANLAGLALALA